MNNSTALPLFLFGLLFVGCGTPRLNDVSLSQIKEEVSTRLDVEKLLGKPDDVISGANLKTLTSYRDVKKRRDSGLLGFGINWYYDFRNAYFLFEPEGRLEKQLISDTKATESAFMFSPLIFGKPITRDKILKVNPTVTTYEEVRELFGPPTTETLTIDGGLVREWKHVRDHGWPFRAKVQEVRVSFDESNRVIDYDVEDDIPEEKKLKYIKWGL